MACCRRLPISTIRPENSGFVDLAERQADRLIPLSTLTTAAQRVVGTSMDTWPIPDGKHLAHAQTEAAEAIQACLRADPWRASEGAAVATSYAVADQGFRDTDGQGWRDAERKEAAAQAGLLRDVIYDRCSRLPFHRVWLSDNVVSLAQTIYDERAFDRLPQLADALGEARCENADILEHCRGPGPHVRGCWVLDLLLARS